MQKTNNKSHNQDMLQKRTVSVQTPAVSYYHLVDIRGIAYKLQNYNKYAMHHCPVLYRLV